MSRDRVTVVPGTDRWRPTRAGLVGLWRYWDETFSFHRGRLLLRGPNGSGKSMALELLLPFLLDGDTSPARLTSAAKSRGRLFDRVMTGTQESSRTGFAWVEFRHGERTFTVGARMRASQATGKVDVDLFTTSRTVGVDLHLLDATRTPLSRRALSEAMGETGRVHASVDEHRTAIREVLFPRFGADRYSSVIGALLALRKEKLSQNLDVDKLSGVLSEALPPLDDRDIAAVAEGFERLDRRRAELAALEHDLAEVKALARQQRDYARAVIVGAAAAVRAAESVRDRITRTEREACDQRDAAEARAATVATDRRALEDRYDQVGVEVDALKDSHAYREGSGLEDLRRQATRLREFTGRAERVASERTQEHATAVTEAEQAAADRDRAAGNLRRAGRDLGSAAEVVGATTAVHEAEALDDPDDAERLVHAWARSRRAGIVEVRRSLDAHDRAVAQRGYFDEHVSADERAVDEREVAQASAGAALTTAVETYREAVDEWARVSACVGERLAAALPRPPEDPAAVAAATAELAAQLRAESAAASQLLQVEHRAAEEERAGHVSQRAQCERGALVDPDPPDWRSPRADRPGAPLWRLVDLAPGAVDSDVNAVEAALTAAGLLDAWVAPDGRVALGPDLADVVLTARPTAGRSLVSLLEPVPEAPVPTDVVTAVLAAIPLADSALTSDSEVAVDADVVVALDGTYRLGSALGRGPARPAILLGAVARERHRLSRLAEIDVDIDAVDARLGDLDRQRAALQRQDAAVAAELAARPSGEPVVVAGRQLATASVRVAEARQRLEATRAERRSAEDVVRRALRDLTALAAQHGLPTSLDALQEVDSGLARLTDVAAVWARRRRDLQAATQQQQRAVGQAARLEQAAARARSDHASAEREARGLEHRVATVESSVGAAYAEIVQRLMVLEEERIANRDHNRRLGEEEHALVLQVGELRSTVQAVSERRAEAEAERDRSHRLLVAAFDALAGDAGIGVPQPLDTATAVLAAARTVATEQPGVDAEPQTVEKLSGRVADRVHQARTALGARVDLDRELADHGWWVLRTVASGVRRRVAELAEALAGELAEGRAELAVEEEQLFERTLAGSVRRALADRIRQANGLVDAINAQLSSIRTAAGGVQVRLRWEVDPDQPPAVKSARSLLLRDPADLSESERTSLQQFVRARVDQARAELEANASWETRLRETLDYRAWHRFTLQLAHRDWDGFAPATPRRLQRLSTGERSVALHLPMIASVAAHYADDDGDPPGCPRLILLDELFAGVDAANRAQLFGTFSAWDLDAVFTSDSEWCQYATLDGIAIHHLHPPTGDEPVTSTRFTWDGRHRMIDPVVA